jgi:hypothetical protein
MAYESESDHGDNDDEGDEFDFEDNDNDNDDDDDDFASRTAEAGGGPDNDDDRSSSSSSSSSDNEEEYDDDDDNDDDACEESWFLDNKGRKDVVVIVNDENDRPNDCKAKGKTKAKANATTTKAKTKTNAKDDKKKRGTSGTISTAASVKFDVDSSSETEFDEDCSSETEIDVDAVDFDGNDTNVYFIVKPFDDAAKKAELILNNTHARMKKQDKGPTTEWEKAYLVTLKSKFAELFKLGYDLISAKCKRDDLGRHVYESQLMKGPASKSAGCYRVVQVAGGNNKGRVKTG